MFFHQIIIKIVGITIGLCVGIFLQDFFLVYQMINFSNISGKLCKIF